jgi:hypothetical protein
MLHSYFLRFVAVTRGSWSCGFLFFVQNMFHFVIHWNHTMLSVYIAFYIYIT